MTTFRGQPVRRSQNGEVIVRQGPRELTPEEVAKEHEWAKSVKLDERRANIDRSVTFPLERH